MKDTSQEFFGDTDNGHLFGHRSTEFVKAQGHRRIFPDRSPGGFNKQRAQILVMSEGHPSGIGSLSGGIDRGDEPDETAERLKAGETADVDDFGHKRHGGNESKTWSGIDSLEGRGKIFRFGFMAQLSKDAREIETCLFELENEIIQRESTGDGSRMHTFEPEKKRTGPTRIGKMHGRDVNAVDTQESLDSVFGASLLLHESESQSHERAELFACHLRNIDSFERAVLEFTGKFA